MRVWVATGPRARIKNVTMDIRRVFVSVFGQCCFFLKKNFRYVARRDQQCKSDHCLGEELDVFLFFFRNLFTLIFPLRSQLIAFDPYNYIGLYCPACAYQAIQLPPGRVNTTAAVSYLRI